MSCTCDRCKQYFEKEKKRELKLQLLSAGLKQCSKCKRIKKIEFFHISSMGINKPNLRGECKSCRSQYNKQFYKRKQLNK